MVLRLFYCRSRIQLHTPSLTLLGSFKALTSIHCISSCRLPKKESALFRSYRGPQHQPYSLPSSHPIIATSPLVCVLYDSSSGLKPLMPPPSDGNEHLPFVDLIKLDKLDDLTYKSIALPFSPGGQLREALPRAYGGHVYAQAAWAACQTVGRGFLLYVCTSVSSPGSPMLNAPRPVVVL